MAGVAANALIDMNTVIEVNVVGQVVDPSPHQRFPRAETIAYGFEDGRIRPDLRVAVHASLGRRDPGVIRIFHRSVAVTAIDAYGGDVVLMAEGHRLGPHDLLIGDVRGAIQFQNAP